MKKKTNKLQNILGNAYFKKNQKTKRKVYKTFHFIYNTYKQTNKEKTKNKYINKNC